MKLTNENIDAVIRKIEKFFKSADAPDRDKLRIGFLMEEALLRYQEKFGEDYDFNFHSRKWFGVPKVFIRIKGTPYNPLEDKDKTQLVSEKVINRLLNYEKMDVVYRYENGYNEIAVFASKERQFKIPGGATTISILLAILAAFVVENFFSPGVRVVILDYVVTPILNRLLGALIAVNIPMIFISVVASICSIEDVTMLNELGSKIWIRFFVIITFITVASFVVNEIFFSVIDLSFEEGFLQQNYVELIKIFNMLLSAIPQNILTPFIEGNILQIVFWALTIGICIAVLGNRVHELKNWIINLKYAIFKLVDMFMKIIPLIIFLCIFKTILSSSFAQILSVWKIIAAEYTLFIVTGLVMLLRVHFKHGIGILDFLKKLSPAFLISASTGSGSSAMPLNIEICKKEFKVDKHLCDFYIPISYALCPTTLLIGIITCVFFAAEFSHAQISIAQVLVIAFLSVQFSISAIEGNGGMVAIMGLLLTQLDLSLDAIGLMMVTDIFIVNVSDVIAMTIQDCDLIDLSRTVHLPNEK